MVIRQGEADLSEPSIVNITQLATVDKSVLAKRVGRVSPGRLHQVLDGLKLLLTPADPFS